MKFLQEEKKERISARLFSDRKRPLISSPYKLFTLLACGALVVLSLLPQTAPPTEYGADKGLHFLGYGGLMLLAAIAWPRASWRWWALALVLGGIGVEIAQSFTPERFASVGDALANSIGVAIGWGVAELVSRRFKK